MKAKLQAVASSLWFQVRLRLCALCLDVLWWLDGVLHRWEVSLRQESEIRNAKLENRRITPHLSVDDWFDRRTAARAMGPHAIRRIGGQDRFHHRGAHVRRFPVGASHPGPWEN
jgi:hypothetical protein